MGGISLILLRLIEPVLPIRIGVREHVAGIYGDLKKAPYFAEGMAHSLLVILEPLHLCEVLELFPNHSLRIRLIMTYGKQVILDCSPL